MAYGARLESVLGESPRGFESPILRQFLRFSRKLRDLDGLGPQVAQARPAGPLLALEGRENAAQDLAHDGLAGARVEHVLDRVTLLRSRGAARGARGCARR